MKEKKNQDEKLLTLRTINSAFQTLYNDYSMLLTILTLKHVMENLLT